MRSRLPRLSRRSRIVGGAVLVLVCVYLMSITVFGRPYGIISFDTSAHVEPGRDVVSRTAGWDQLYLSDLIGKTLAESKRKLGTPGVDNTLAPEGQGGLIVRVDAAPDHAEPAPEMIVVGYCVFMELADRHFLTLAVADPATIDSAARRAIVDEPEQVAYRYMAEHRCDSDAIGQFTPWLVVRPFAQR
ncbi:hypothetical protein [Gordonia shandongensis]|uniref:hypothetical protein n=1 Tax=Gordonia shandongensis TaxID=376351 RepID=UPI0003FF8358|nr:hypothetical protein [Gordonia shandongensis]